MLLGRVFSRAEARGPLTAAASSIRTIAVGKPSLVALHREQIDGFAGDSLTVGRVTTTGLGGNSGEMKRPLLPNGMDNEPQKILPEQVRRHLVESSLRKVRRA